MQKNDESEHEINSQQSCFQLYCRTEKSWFLHGEVTSQYCITSQNKVKVVKVIKNKSKSETITKEMHKATRASQGKLQENLNQ